MANAQKWRPFVLAAAALIVIATAFIWQRKVPTHQAPGHSYSKCATLASKLSVESAKRLASVPPRLRPALLTVIAQANFQLYTLLKITPKGYFPEDTSIWESLRQIGKDLGAVTIGSDPFARRTGHFIRGYLSSIGGPQGYSINIPEEYAGRRSFPLVVSLHGFGGSGRWQIPSAPRLPGAVSVAPRGFGPTDFKYIGERDVLDVIRDVRLNYNIDADRVYLIGGSMGGTGCWSIGAHHPDLFAAIAPTAGLTDFRVWEEPGNLKQSSPLERMIYFQKAAVSASFLAENMLNLPVYCLHGSDDPITPVAHSRLMMAALKKAGNTSVVYWEFPGFGHGAFPSAFTRERYNWLLLKRRVRDPEHVIYKTASLRHPGAYWLLIERRPSPVAFSRIEGKIAGDAVNIATSNVSRFRIRTPAGLRNVEQLAVNVDGALAYSGKPEPLLVFESDREGWRRTTQPTEGLVKRQGLSGPVEDAFLSPFMLVHGDGDKIAGSVLENLHRRWSRQVQCPVRHTRDVDDNAIARYNLILIGNPQTNPLMAQVMESLPIKMSGDRITCGDRTYQGDDLGLKMCCPNPLNPRRYVVLLASVGYNGMLQLNNRFGNWFYWVIYNNRNWFDYAVFDDGTSLPDSFLEVGFFDSDWKLNDSFRWMRSPDVAYRRRNVPGLASVAEAPEEFHLSSLRPAALSAGKGPVGFDQRPDAAPLLDAEKKPRHGLMMLAPARITYRLNGAAKEMTFAAWAPEAGKRFASKTEPCVSFTVVGDGKKLYSSGAMAPGEATQPATVLLGGVKELSLVVARAGGPSWIYLPAAWLDLTVRKNAP